jgi:glycosyltransferase involved in cell wall biosynthesis
MGACNSEGIPLIVHFHGFDAYDQSILEEYQSPYKKMFSAAEAVIAVSKQMESQLLALGADREKVFYNPYGIDTSLFAGVDPAASPPAFLFVGRFVDKKAPHLTILAFKKVFTQFPDARLIMIGEGPLWEACKQIARALGVSEAVEFLGRRSHTQVAAVMRQVRALVQHSMRTTYGDSEGTPLAILEAGSTGIPVVATRHAGIKDAVVEKETGFLVDEGDIEGMAKCMLRLAKEPPLASRMGKNARERICIEYSMERSIHNLSKIIETSIQSRKTPSLRIIKFVRTHVPFFIN